MEKNPHAQALGRLGGQARTKALSPERRKEIATIASEAAKLAKQKRKLVSNTTPQDFSPHSPGVQIQ